MKSKKSTAPRALSRADLRKLSDAELLAKVRETGGDPHGVAHDIGCTCPACIRAARERFGLVGRDEFQKAPSGRPARGRSNDLPIPTHGDSLRQELTDLLGMLSHLQELIPQRRPEAAMQQAVDCYALLRSILGTPQPQTHTTDGRRLPK